MIPRPAQNTKLHHPKNAMRLTQYMAKLTLISSLSSSLTAQSLNVITSLCGKRTSSDVMLQMWVDTGISALLRKGHVLNRTTAVTMTMKMIHFAECHIQEI